MSEILLIASNWQFRALVRAQLLEEGYTVRALPSPGVALATLQEGGQRPRLTVLDAQGIEIDAGLLSDLGRLTEAPLILCGGLLDRAALARGGLPATAKVLLRPFRLGDLVKEVRKVL